MELNIMEINIANIGHIEKAQIDVESITVIAGNNNTGKSTVGKVLYATATGLNLLDSKKVLIEKGEVIASKIDTFSRLIELDDEEEAVLEVIKNYCFFAEYLFEFKDKKDEEIDRLFSEKVKKDIEDIVTKILHRATGSKKNVLKLVQEDINVYLNRSISDKNYKVNIMQKVFDGVFAKQLTSFINPDELSSIAIKELNQKEIKLSFYNQQLNLDNTNLELDRPFNKAIYIDNPFILDDMPTSSRRIPLRRNNYSYSNFLMGIISNGKNLSTTNLFELDIREEHIQDIFKYVMKEGKLSFNDGISYIMNDKVSTPLSLQNLSTGLKSFSIIELLLKSEVFSKLEYLILDEPEIHLHPEWQLKFAELIVLISKQFNIKVIITSHSPYFIEAIELYSKKHLYSSDVKFYRTYESRENKGLFNIEDVSDNVKKLYRDLAIAFYDLEQLRSELKYGKSGENEDENS